MSIRIVYKDSVSYLICYTEATERCHMDGGVQGHNAFCRMLYSHGICVGQLGTGADSSRSTLMYFCLMPHLRILYRLICRLYFCMFCSVASFAWYLPEIIFISLIVKRLACYFCHGLSQCLGKCGCYVTPGHTRFIINHALVVWNSE